MNLESFKDKRLTTDEVALVRTEIKRLTEELENFNYKTGDDYILLKWGTLKYWKLGSEKGKKLLEEYYKLGSSMSAISQKDTPEQKELICKMIDECDGTIQSDWTGEYFTKEKAKEYINDYESNK